MEPSFSECLVLLKNRVTLQLLVYLKLNTVISAKRTAKISVFIAFSYKNASLFSNKFHQIKVVNVKVTKWFVFQYDTVRAFTKKKRLKGRTVKFKSRKSSRFQEKIMENVRCAVDQNCPTRKTVRYGTVRYGHGRRINSDPLLYMIRVEHKNSKKVKILLQLIF